jgi:hypothetical protein
VVRPRWKCPMEIVVWGETTYRNQDGSHAFEDDREILENLPGRTLLC